MHSTIAKTNYLSKTNLTVISEDRYFLAANVRNFSISGKYVKQAVIICKKQSKERDKPYKINLLLYNRKHNQKKKETISLHFKFGPFSWIKYIFLFPSFS